MTHNIETLNALTTMLIDWDGVLFREHEPQPGLQRLFQTLEARGIRWAVVTNNATRNPAVYAERLREHGVRAEPGQVFSSGRATVATLKMRYEPGTPFYVIGTDAFRSLMREAGFRVYHGEELPSDPITAVVVGLDTDLSYKKLEVATRLIRGRGVKFIGTNPDRTFPTPTGLVPGNGTVVAALEASTDVVAEIIGKPEPGIFHAAMAYYDATPEETGMIGDRLNTDIAGAGALGITTILMLSGVTTLAELRESDIQPDHVFDGIAAFTEALEQLPA